ncbi:hypothetical protein [Salmonella enterica]|nr:hypothetical protein [Salmonella enterica]AXD16828.1 hypothetical protein CHC58_24775 [Salmonella enterica]
MTDQASIPVDTPVLALATDAYSSLKNILNDNGTSDTTGTCMFASLLVCEFAHRRGMSAAVRGGNGTDDGGIFNESGGHGHYWCEVSAGEMIFYIDIAAEQFGYPSFIIKNANDVSGWPRYIPGDQVTVDEHVRMALLQIVGGDKLIIPFC